MRESGQMVCKKPQPQTNTHTHTHTHTACMMHYLDTAILYTLNTDATCFTIEARAASTPYVRRIA